jgi:hypothetical protein
MPGKPEFYAARRQLARAVERGDLDTAIRWTMIMRQQISIARRFIELANHKPHPRPKPPKPAPPARPVRTGPVMLDPKDFSPGGQPN